MRTAPARSTPGTPPARSRRPPPRLEVRCPEGEADLEGVVELSARTFGTYARFRADAEAWYLRHSHYDPRASAIGLLGGELVTHWGCWGYRMRTGRAVVRCGGIGAVATAADHRGQGLMARTARYALARLRARGYHLSILFGIDDFYHRFGYVPAWPEARWTIRCADLPDRRPPVDGLRRLPLAPTPALARLHARASAGLTGTAVRPTYTRSLSGMRPGAEVHGWGDRRGGLAGHVVVAAEEKTTLVCAEASGAPDEALAVLGRLARRRALSALRFDTLPYGSALAARLRGLDCRYEQRYARSGQAMVRLVDLAGWLAALAPELSARLAASPLAGYRGALRVRGPEGEAALTLGAGRVAVGPARGARSGGATVEGGAALARLLLGSDEPLEVCEAGRIRLSGDAARLVQTLFPAQHPQLHLADRF